VDRIRFGGGGAPDSGHGRDYRHVVSHRNCHFIIPVLFVLIERFSTRSRARAPLAIEPKPSQEEA
jgi:hypothetical protein